MSTNRPLTFQACAHDPIAGEEHPTALAARVASHFDLPSPLEAFDFPEKGNIHQHTFLIRSGTARNSREYLLQRINQQVFAYPKQVMAAMIACLESQRRNLARIAPDGGRIWEPIRLVPTRRNTPYLECSSLRGTTYWRMMERIPGCVSYKSLSQIRDREAQLALAEEAARGLAIYIDLTADMDVAGLSSSLPGYRDTRLYYNQMKSAAAGNRTLEEAEPWLPKDEKVRRSTARHFLVHIPPAEWQRRLGDPELRPYLELAQRREEYGLSLLREMEAGRIRTVAIHGDTKLDNFLFCAQSGRVRSLVDLDTIMPHTWLVDWGDMVRSLVNLAGEKEADLTKVDVDLEIYNAMARGFLSTARRITGVEISWMVDAVQIIALELGVRFLADHLRGDSYFKLSLTDPPDLNKARAMVQLELFEKLGRTAESARRCIRRLAPPSAGRDMSETAQLSDST